MNKFDDEIADINDDSEMVNLDGSQQDERDPMGLHNQEDDEPM